MTEPSNVPLPHVSQALGMRGKTLRARVYLPGHQPGLADNGVPGERYIDYHRQRARAGLGMQITGATPVMWSEVWADGRTLINIDDRIVPGYRALAKAVHEEGGLMLAQLAHVGAMETAGEAIVSASWEHSELTQRMSREATPTELAEIAELYRGAAMRCREGDLDGVEVTMAHGMLLASFLSPLMNRRQDRFGGDRDGRTLFPRQVLAAVREALGEDRIIGIRIPGDEMVDGGIDAVEAVAIAQRLVATGTVDYVSVTAGNNTRKMARVDHWPPTPAPFGAFRHLSRAVKGGVDVPVATVGRVTTVALAEEILAMGDADLVGMVRAHVADPRLLPKSRSGALKTVRPCIGANVCINALMDHKSLTCMVNPEIGRRPETLDRPIYASRPAVVVGAGPAGLEAARRLALRGFETTLIEAGDKLGGQLAQWSETPSRQEFKRIIGWWGDELDRLGVRVRTNTEATVDGLRALQPSVVLLATGSTPLPSPTLQAGLLPSYGAYEAPAAGGHVVVYDEMGRLAAMLTAERLAQSWRKVTFVTSMLHPAEGEGLTTAYSLLRALAGHGVTIIDRAKVTGIQGDDVVLQGVFGEPRPPVQDVDAVVSLSRVVSRNGLLEPLRAARIDTRLIGDAKLPRGVTEAVQDAATTVWSLDDGRNDVDAGRSIAGAAV
ncbi:FAD-dependent oxidoreductase [Lichenifustis flavocetrariae]|uniref:NAD(P)-binding protein n=1 Tax=Lichenifustis flavocetrariae TaxID=2949735 RepID=A0AA42CL46_9HYPH|nr:FAD-dependent oxidoreductase [Lichenifustis flavocetrariae]MCW6511239.1 NAD(P)-binding protein [Lichenifustis flavocetrariae]